MAPERTTPLHAPPEPPGATPRDLILVAGIPSVLAIIIAILSVRFGVVRRLAHALLNAPGLVSGLAALAVLSPIAALVVVWSRLHSEHEAHLHLTEMARLDSLTGLPNRFGLDERLAEAVESSRRTGLPFAVLFADLDRFKIVNDTFGHEVGDALMRSAASRLRQALRPVDQVVRYGGDEFVVICPDVANAGTGERIANRVIEALEQPFTIGRQSLSISCSIGLALADQHVLDADQVVRDADVAMYQAKGAGPGAFRVFDRTIGGTLTPSAIEERLRSAMELNQFRVHYQPVVETATGQIMGVEALLRWNDPERGLVSPDDFLPILEETGLIVPVGEWVFQEACKQAMRWRKAFPECPLELKVNVSARQLSQVDFGDMITRVLAETELPATSVFLEITESALMDDVSSAWSVLRDAKTRGVRLALDDFGTGFSSLSYIRRFSLDMLKIDKSFVDGLAHEPDDVAIVEHVIGMARALGMVTVAEGVEQAEQLRQLQQLNCDRAQGFWFSPPVPAELIGPMLTDPVLAERWSNVSPAAPVTPPAVQGEASAPGVRLTHSPRALDHRRGNTPASQHAAIDAAGEYDLPPMPRLPAPATPTFDTPKSIPAAQILPPTMRPMQRLTTPTEPSTVPAGFTAPQTLHFDGGVAGVSQTPPTNGLARSDGPPSDARDGDSTAPSDVPPAELTQAPPATAAQPFAAPEGESHQRVAPPPSAPRGPGGTAAPSRSESARPTSASPSPEDDPSSVGSNHLAALPPPNVPAQPREAAAQRDPVAPRAPRVAPPPLAPRDGTPGARPAVRVPSALPQLTEVRPAAEPLTQAATPGAHAAEAATPD